MNKRFRRERPVEPVNLLELSAENQWGDNTEPMQDDTTPKDAWRQPEKQRWVYRKSMND